MAACGESEVGEDPPGGGPAPAEASPGEESQECPLSAEEVGALVGATFELVVASTGPIECKYAPPGQSYLDADVAATIVRYPAELSPGVLDLCEAPTSTAADRSFAYCEPYPDIPPYGAGEVDVGEFEWLLTVRQPTLGGSDLALVVEEVAAAAFPLD
jgi:hypothetical protein